MPTNEERREIAAAIREYAKAWESTPPLDAIELDDDERQAVAFEILDLLGVDFEKVEKTSSCYRIVSDLIEPEPERKAKARPFPIEKDTGYFDTTKCECGYINDVSATYCGQCGCVIEVVG
jgi:hypothetical protein